MEYGCPVWHTGLPNYLSDTIKNIGPEESIFYYKPRFEILEHNYNGFLTFCKGYIGTHVQKCT